MIKIYTTLAAAQAARAELPTEIGGFAYTNHVRKTLDGKYAVISMPASCYLPQDTLARYNLPADTFGWLDEGEPEEAAT